MDNVRFNISPCTAGEVSELIAKIDTGMYTVNGVTKASERSHYDRYGFLCEDCRVAVVYDTSAHILSITGRQDHAQKLLDLFAPVGKYVKRSTVPAQGTVPGKRDRSEASVSLEVPSGKRAKIFVPPERLQRQAEVVPVGTAFASARGAILYTDEIFPPQTAKKRPLPSYGEKPTATAFRSGISSEDMLSGRPIGSVKQPPERQEPIPKPISPSSESEQGSDNARVGLAINASAGRTQTSLVPRKASICFGSEDDAAEPVKPLPSEPPKRKRGRPPKNKEQAPAVPQKQTSVTPPVRPTPDVQPAQNAAASDQGAVQKKRRGRPPKNRQQEPAQKPELSEQKSEQKPEFKTGGYSIKNFPLDALAGALKRLKSFGKKVVTEPVENKDTPQEVRAFTVSDERGQKVILRYATKRMTLALQGKHSDLFGEVVSQVSHDSDYSSALENYVQKDKPQPAGADKSVQTSSNAVRLICL